MNRSIDEDGFTIIPGVLCDDQTRELIAALGSVEGAGRRGLLGSPVVAALARSSPILELVRPYLPTEPFPVRSIYFDKSPGSNWLVPWHQDLSLAVQRRVDVPGFGPWSVKEGVAHVQPPASCLEAMLTVRIHLDVADESNGALRVIPGSHRQGRLDPARVLEVRGSGEEVVCFARAGDVLLMRPLILHASGRSASERHRRVLHLEYASYSLPGGLCWHESPAGA